MEAPESGAQCPSCGVPIAPGYPRCPRCQASLPQAASPLSQASHTSQLVSGGTSVVHRKSTLPWGWIAAGVAAVAVIAGIAIGTGDDDAAQEESAVTVADESVDEPELAPAAAAANPTVSVDGLDDTASDRGAARDDAVIALEDSLSSQRLWSKTRAEGDVVVVVSGSCEDPAMRAAIDAQRQALASVGFETLRCVAKHGAPVFELDL